MNGGHFSYSLTNEDSPREWALQVEGWLRPARGGGSTLVVKGKDAVKDHGDGSYTLELKVSVLPCWERAPSLQ